MSISGLLPLIDDIASLLDDVGVMTRITAKKTAGLLGDDLALNAEQVTGVAAARELPVVWSVAKGSLLNKAILIPAALALNSFLPWATIPLLMAGGLFLCYEGFHKVYSTFFGHHHSPQNAHEAEGDVAALTAEEFEKKRVFGAIRTDFILSAEIIVISLGEVLGKPLIEQALVLSIVGVGLTFFVYGLVGFIVKIDDIGAFLAQKGGGVEKVGRLIVWAAPIMMRIIGIIGTIAMFLVGGGIFSHNIESIHHLVETSAANVGSMRPFIPFFMEFVLGLLLGMLVMLIVDPVKRLISRSK